MMVKDARLHATEAPWLFTFEGTAAQGYELAWKLADGHDVAKVVRGQKMPSLPGLFDEFGAAFQFPDYFGENGAALEECLSDLSWMPATTYVVIIGRAIDMLASEQLDRVSAIKELFERVAEIWAEPLAKGEAWDRPAVPFHIVLQAERDEHDALLAKWGDIPAL